MKYCILCVSLFLSANLLAQTAITDPVPDPLPSNGVGVRVETVARIPNSPSSGTAPRLNMIKEASDGSGRLFVIDQRGYLYAILQDDSVVRYLDVRAHLGSSFLFNHNQNGSTSFAFHPDFALNGLLYIICSAPLSSGSPDFFAKRPIDPSQNGTDPREPQFHDVLYEFKASNPSSNAFSGTFREVLRIEQPYADHNVGEIAFNPNARQGDPDYGLIYGAVADGGNKFPISDADPEDNGQDTQTIHGTIIRIDPAGTNSENGKYGIPEDNPFADGVGGLPEIWSFGHRNNHRLAWDTRGTQSLYTFEMGQALIEEINRIVPAGNFGWGDREGNYLLTEFNELQVTPIPVDEPEESFQYPVFQYDHPWDSGAIAGGAVYRGSAIPSLYGKIVTADFTGNRGAFYGIVSESENLPYTEAANLHHLDIYTEAGVLSDLSTAVLGPSGTRRTDLRIGTDLRGEIYFLNKRNGWVHRLVASPVEPAFSASIDKSAFGPEGGSATLNVDTVESFDWTVEVDDFWIEPASGPSFSGSGSVQLSVSPLPVEVESRESKVVVAGKVLTIFQQATAGAPWELVFPGGSYMGSGYYDTSALGPLYFPEWPWIHVVLLGNWSWVSEESSTQSGVWIYHPKL